MKKLLHKKSTVQCENYSISDITSSYIFGDEEDENDIENVDCMKMLIACQ